MRANKLMLLACMCVAIFSCSTETMGQKLSDVVRWNNGKAYLFYDTGQYVRFDIASDKADPGYPKPIANNWLGIWENKIDAALTWIDGKVYFFKGSQYIRYDMAKDQADEGYPADISKFWHGLWDRDIDSAVMWNDGYAYFFKGDKVMKYEVTEKHRPEILKIKDRFNGLWEEGIDAAVLWNSTTAFFFHGDRYVKYDVVHNKVFEGYPRPIIGNWNGLTSNQAAYFGWRGYADTSLKFSEFFNKDHTVMARFMTQFPYGYAGPVFGESSNGAYVVGQGNFTAFHKIDAAVVPQSMWPANAHKAYFFRGTQVMRFDISGNKADDDYPKPIKAEFPGLWAGGDLDAAMMAGLGRVFFFKGDEYILYDVQQREVKAKGKINDRFPGTWQRDIDAALNWPDGKVYLFKGNKYIRFNINSNTAEATFEIKDQWHGLAERHFDSRLDDAVLWPDGRAYFFKSGKFVDYSVNLDRAIGGARSIGDYFPGLNWNTLPQLVMKIGEKEQAYAASSLTLGKWVDIAVVRSGNIFRLYLNGTFMEPAIVIDPDHDTKLPTGENRLRLGRRTDGESVHGTEAQFYGLIDDVVVFNKALTLQEIKERSNQIGPPIKRHDTNLIAAWFFDELRDPPEIVTNSKIVFRSKTAGITPSGVTLVSHDDDNQTDRGLLPLPFQQIKRQLPFKTGQAWRVTQGMGNPNHSHYGQYVFSIDFALAGEESPNKIPNPNDNGSACGEPVFATADGNVTWRVDVGGGTGDKNDFDGPNQLHIQHTWGEADSYYHLFTGSIDKFIPNNQGFTPVKRGQQVGTVGTLNGCHLHTGVFEFNTSEVSFPGEFSNYDVSDDHGSHWRRIDRGTPSEGQWVRRRPN